MSINYRENFGNIIFVESENDIVHKWNYIRAGNVCIYQITVSNHYEYHFSKKGTKSFTLRVMIILKTLNTGTFTAMYISDILKGQTI